jgi:hypothetical protein
MCDDTIIKEAESAQELFDCYRVRFQAFCRDNGHLNAADYPDEIETDKYDDYSIHFIAYSGGRGAARPA